MSVIFKRGIFNAVPEIAGKPRAYRRNSFPRCPLPETLLGQAAPPGQQHTVDRIAGRQPYPLLQALALGVVQVEQLGVLGALGQVFVAGFQLVDQFFSCAATPSQTSPVATSSMTSCGR